MHAIALNGPSVISATSSSPRGSPLSNAASTKELASYDSAKQAARGVGVSESPALHVACAALSGVFAQFCCMPADVIKVRAATAVHVCSRCSAHPWP